MVAGDTILLGADRQQQEQKAPRVTNAARAIPLGARVRFARHIQRTEYGEHRGHRWDVVPDSPGEGAFVGYRYKQNGIWETEYEDGYGRGASSYWQEDSRVKVALVVTHAWQEPWTVDPEGLEVIATDSLAGAPVPAVDPVSEA